MKRAVPWALFALYLAALAFATMFTRRGGIPSFENATWAWVNLIPFRVVPVTFEQVVMRGNLTPLWLNFFGNIAVFIPIGALLPVIKRGASRKATLLFAFSISLIIELCQLTLPRFSDVDDLILNTTGALLGWLLYCGIQAMRDKRAGRTKTAQASDGG